MPRFKPYDPQNQRDNSHFTVYGYKRRADPFPLGFGTLPEKIVYEHLSRRNIEFYYLNDIDVSIPDLEIFKSFQADFMIPSLRLIIEVQGAYFHSKPATIESDAIKFAFYEMAGYKVLAWWDYDIEANVNKLFDQSPELTAASHFTNNLKSAEIAPKNRTKTDTSKGIRTMNQKRGTRLLYRKKPVTVKSRKQKNYGIFNV